MRPICSAALETGKHLNDRSMGCRRSTRSSVIAPLTFGLTIVKYGLRNRCPYSSVRRSEFPLHRARGAAAQHLE